MRDKSLATATAAVLAAFAVAHLMQFGLSAGRALSDDARTASVGIASYLAGAPQSGVRAVRTPQPPPDPTTASGLAPPPRSTGRVPATSAARSAVLPGAVNRFGLLCRRALVATARPGGLMRVSLDAPCDPEVRVEILHAGLRFALSTGPDGRREVVLPALEVAAEVAARFADGSVVETGARVPDAAQFGRLAVVMEGGRGVALDAGSGEVHRLGDPGVAAPVLAEVHTLATGRLGPIWGAAPRVEVMVAPFNCARDVVAEVLRTGPDGPVERMTLRFAMPDCSAIGDVVTLVLPMADVRLARN